MVARPGKPELVLEPLPSVVVEVECNLPDCAYSGKRNGHYKQPHDHYTYGEFTFSVLKEEKIEFYDGPLFKWIGSDNRSGYGDLKWGLPKNGQPGAWAEPDSKLLATCNHGLHALMPGQRGFNGARLFVAETDGPIMITPSKVVCARLRLVREVGLDAVVTEEMKQAAWNEKVKLLVDKAPPYTYFSARLPVAYRGLVKKTRRATVTAVRQSAKPLLVEEAATTKVLTQYDRVTWPRLSGAEIKTDWTAYQAARKDRDRIRRKLRVLDHIVAEAQSIPNYGSIPYAALPEGDLKTYMGEKS